MVLLNLFFDLVIVALAIFVYQKMKNPLASGVAAAFGLFAVSYLLTMADVTSSSLLVPIRTLGYLSAVLGLFLTVRRSTSREQ